MLRVLPLFSAMLTVLFIGLKLTNNIDWSWFWVLSPLWIPPITIFTIVGFIVCMVALIQKIQDS